MRNRLSPGLPGQRKEAYRQDKEFNRKRNHLMCARIFVFLLQDRHHDQRHVTVLSVKTFSQRSFTNESALLVKRQSATVLFLNIKPKAMRLIGVKSHLFDHRDNSSSVAAALICDNDAA